MVDKLGHTIADHAWNGLPVLLLILGSLLLAFCVIWAAVLVSAVKKARANRQAVDEADAPERDAQAEQAPSEAEERCRRLEELVQAQNRQISSMSQQLADAARLRHDFRQELLLLREFARNGDREALERYLPQVTLEGQAFSIPLCPNPLVNTVLQFYFGRAREADIEIDAVVEADESLWLTAGDTGVLFGNLLENAVTAAAEASGGQRRLRLRTAQTKGSFVIAMGNTFGAPRSIDEAGAFSSTKSDHKGIGLDSIRSVAHRYDGEAKFEISGDLFMSYVILFRPAEEVREAEKDPMP